MEQEAIARYRVVYSKKGMLRFCGHLDMQRLWERALRRSGLPVRYSQGFSPKARLNLATALPLGYVSACEVLDFWMNELLPESEVQQILQRNLPVDLLISSVSLVANELPSLQSSVTASDFVVRLPHEYDFEALNEKLERLKESGTLMRTKRGKTYDLLPLIEAIALNEIDGKPVLQLRMSARPGATGRPDEVLDAMGIDSNACIVERTGISY